MVHKIQKDLFAPKDPEEAHSLGFELFFVILPGIAVMGIFSLILLLKYFNMI